MDKSNKNIRLGIFVILISFIFTYVVYKVSGGSGFLNDSIELHADFSDVEGLLVGNNVRYSGIKVGTVTEIKVISDKQLRVIMSLDKKVLGYMRTNAEADIGTNGLVGNMLINISPGEGEAPLVTDGIIIGSKKNVDITTMLNTLSETNQQIAQISETLLEITEKINNGSGSIAQLINDGSLAENLKATTRNLTSTSSLVRTSTDSINALILGISEGEGNLGYLLKDTSLKTQISALSHNLDSLINERTQPILENLEKTSESITIASSKLESIISGIEGKDGLLGTVLNDTTITQDLKSTLDNLNNGTQKFDESMEALQHHWLLRGFFKKKKKEAEKAKKENKDELAKIES